MVSERREIAFVLTARDRASGQFRRVEESAGGLRNQFVSLLGVVVALRGPMRLIAGRAGFLGIALRRLIGAFLGLTLAGKLVAVGLLVLPFVLGKVLGTTQKAIDAWIDMQQATRGATARLLFFGNTIEEAESKLNIIRDTLNKAATIEFLNMGDAVSALADLDNDLIATFIKMAKEAEEKLGLSIPKSFAALASASRNNVQPMKDLVGQSDLVLRSFEDGADAILAFQESMDAIDITNIEKTAAAWDRVGEALELNVGPAIRNVIAFFERAIPELILLVIGFVKSTIGGMVRDIKRGIEIAVVIFLGFARFLVGFRTDMIGSFRRLGQGIINVWTFVRETTFAVIDAVREKWRGAINFILAQWDRVKGIFDKLSGFVGAAGSRVGSAARRILPLLDDFQHGGVIPGPIGAPVPIMAHGGERVIPAGRNTPMVIQLVLDRKVISEVAIDAFMRISKFRAGAFRGSIGEGL